MSCGGVRIGIKGRERRNLKRVALGTSVVSQLVSQATRGGGSPETVNQDGETYELSMSETSTIDQIEVEIDEDAGLNIDVTQNEDKKLKNEKKFACRKCGKKFYKKAICQRPLQD